MSRKIKYLFRIYNEETKTFNMHENIDPKNILEYGSCIFMYSTIGRKNINDIFDQCLHLYGIPCFDSIVSNKVNITKFVYNINNKNIYLF